MSYPIGETKIINLKCDLGSENSGEWLKPPPGYEWLLYFLFGYQDDILGDDKNLIWTIYSKVRDYTLNCCYRSVSGMEKLYFRVADGDIEIQNWGMPMKFTWDCYPVLMSGDAIPADKRLYVAGMVMERPADIELLKLEWVASAVNIPMPSGLEALRDRMATLRGGIT